HPSLPNRGRGDFRTESRNFKGIWIPASAGMTARGEQLIRRTSGTGFCCNANVDTQRVGSVYENCQVSRHMLGQEDNQFMFARIAHVAIYTESYEKMAGF